MAMVFFAILSPGQVNKDLPEQEIFTGAERLDFYMPRLKGRSVGIVANQTSMVGSAHLVDTLLALGVKVVKVFGPEHGFRGFAGAGEHVEDGHDPVTGLEVVSLYGSKRKPAPEDLAGLDLMVFDMQDVGARFYTYISTMSYVMESCAENDIPVLVLDRPNPHGDYIDGPVLDTAFSSFVGLHPVPVVHGMTIAEYARMVNGEGWMKNRIKCLLHVVPMLNYTHNTPYELPVPPSPNLPNQKAILLYPSLCFFEGTIISIGRGTEYPFQVVGHPDYKLGSFVFMPEDRPGAAINPKYEGQLCYGMNLSGFADYLMTGPKRLHLGGLIDMYNYFKGKQEFFIPYFDKLAGTDQLRLQIEAGKNEKEIRDSWKGDLNQFRELRKKYLLYPDFY